MNALDTTITERHGFARIVRPAGYKVVPERAFDSLVDIAENCAEAGVNKVLVVSDGLEIKLSRFEIFKAGELMVSKGIQFAIVAPHDINSETARFLENMTANRGYPLQFFADEDAAKKWLGV